MHGGTLLKSVSVVGFLETPSSWEYVSFHREVFCVTNFGLVIRIFIVNAMIFIKKNIDNLVQDHFLQTVKDHPYDKLLKKLCLVFFSSLIKKVLVIKNLRTCVFSVLKICWYARFWICHH